MRFRRQCEQISETLSESGSTGMKAVSQQIAREIASVKCGTTLLDALLFHVHPLTCFAFADPKQRPHFHALRACMEVKDNRLRMIWLAISASLFALWFHGIQLRSRLFAITDRVVRAKGDLFAAGEQKLLAALHQVLLVEGPGIHEV